MNNQAFSVATFALEILISLAGLMKSGFQWKPREFLILWKGSGKGFQYFQRFGAELCGFFPEPITAMFVNTGTSEPSGKDIKTTISLSLEVVALSVS